MLNFDEVKAAKPYKRAAKMALSGGFGRMFKFGLS